MPPDAPSDGDPTDSLVTGWLAGQVDAFGAAGAVVVRLEGPSGCVRPQCWAGFPDELVASWGAFPVAAPTPFGEALRTGEIVTVSDLDELVDRFPLLAGRPPSGYAALAAVPLLDDDDRPFAALGLSFTSGARLAAARPALAHLGERLRRRLLATPETFAVTDAPSRGPSGPDDVLPGGMWHLQELADRLVTAVTPEDVLAAVLDRAAPLLGARTVAISLLDPTRTVLRLVLTNRTVDEVRNRFETYPVDAPLPARDALATGQPLIFHRRADLDARYPALADLPPSAQSYVTLPLAGLDAPVGVLTLGWDAPQAFPPAQVNTLLEVARLCGTALARAGVYRAEQDARAAAERVSRRLRALNQVTGRLAGATEPHQVVDAVLAAASDTLGATAAALISIDPVTRTFLVLSGIGLPEPVATSEVPAPVERLDVARELVSTGAPVLITNSAERDERFPDMARVGLRQQSWAILPFVTNGRVVGWASFGWDDPTSFAAEDVEFLMTVAAHTSVAVERSQLLARSRGVAETLQRALLPDVVDVPGWDLATLYLPAVTGTEVGGDWFDTFTLAGGRVGLVVGDVSGKGVRAAAAMGAVRSALRAFATLDQEPREVLTRLDGYLATFKPEEFVTVLYALLEPATGRLVYSSAGHPPALLVDGDGTRWLSRVDPPLGAPVPQQRAGGEMTLPIGSVLVLYSDGLVERRHESIENGLTALATAAAALRTAPDLDAGVRDLSAALEHPDSTDDDRAVLALRRRLPDQLGPADRD